MTNFRLRTTVLVVLASLMLPLAGCEEPSEGFEQAGRDLEQGGYEYALEGYRKCYEEGVLAVLSARGAGIACLRMGQYEDAIKWFTDALNGEKVDKTTRKDLLSYRAAAYMKAGQYDNAMADCQTLKVDFGEDAEICFLNGAIALAMDAYEEASDNFDRAYQLSGGYEMAIRIYQQYTERGMEADGTRFLEMSLTGKPQTGEDYCDRGRVYYYMEDYQSAASELTSAVNMGSTDALLLLGMVYNAQHQSSKARAMYQQYMDEGGSMAKGYDGLALCDIEESRYDSALASIESGKPYASTEELQSLLFNEIVVYEKKLDFDTARQKAEEYAALFPEDEKAVKELEFLRTRKNAPSPTPEPAEEENSGETESGDASYDESYYDSSYDESYYDSSYDESYYDSSYDESYYDDSYDYDSY